MSGEVEGPQGAEGSISIPAERAPQGKGGSAGYQRARCPGACERLVLIPRPGCPRVRGAGWPLVDPFPFPLSSALSPEELEGCCVRCSDASRSGSGLNVPEIPRGQLESRPLGQRAPFACACVHSAVLFAGSALKTWSSSVKIFDFRDEKLGKTFGPGIFGIAEFFKS